MPDQPVTERHRIAANAIWDDIEDCSLSDIAEVLAEFFPDREPLVRQLVEACKSARDDSAAVVRSYDVIAQVMDKLNAALASAAALGFKPEK